MNKSLNIPVLEETMFRKGLKQSDLAAMLTVSREAVSKWIKGTSMPQPDKLMRIGMLLGLTFEQLVKREIPTAEPRVAYRVKAHHITKDKHLDNARETGELLKLLVQHLPFSRIASPATLKDPITDYNYIQLAASDVRKEMEIEDKNKIGFSDLIRKFNSLHAIIVPVLWGAREHHGNAINIHLPDSQTTWVFLNLDSNAIDFKFWMAHELGHSLSPTLGEKTSEDFADAFAQALLFPESDAERLHPVLARATGVGQRVTLIHREAEKHLISPYTIRLAIQAFEKARGLSPIDLGPTNTFMASVHNFGKGYQTMTELLLGKQPPSPSEYIKTAKKHFDSPFFDALSAYCKIADGSEHFIRAVLDVPITDAKALAAELRR